MQNDNQAVQSNNDIDSLRMILKKTREELEAAQKTIQQLQDARQLIYRFLHILCNYEIKTPILSIIGFSNFLNKKNESFTEEQKSDLAIIEKNAQQILYLLNQTLNLVQLDAYISGFHNELHFEEIDLGHIINHRASSLGGDAEIKVNLSDNLPKIRASFRGVDYIITGVVWALSQDEGTKITINASYDEDWVIIRIVNTGFTIPKSVLEEFTNAKPPLTMFGQIGLRNCRHVVEIQGGEMYFDTQKEDETVVTFTLPIYKSDSSVI